MKKPDLFLIGAPKAGTSALADALARHPDIFCEKKEPRYFDACIFYDDLSKANAPNEDDYLNLYTGDKAQAAKYRLDASVFIMYSPESIERILEMSPQAKFIISVRDPIGASQSMFHQRLKYPDETMREVSSSFRHCWNLLPQRNLGYGFPANCNNSNLFRYDFLYHYERHIPRLLEVIPQEQFKIVFYEDFKRDPDGTVNDIVNFCGLRHSLSTTVRSVNRSYFSERTTIEKLKFRMLRFLAFRTERIRRNNKLMNSIGKFGSRVLHPSQKQLPECAFVDKETQVEMLDEFAETYKYLKDLGDQLAFGKL